MSWYISDLAEVKENGKTVFSCFCGAGGSSLGYKLAGFKTLGGVDIDPKILDLYRRNLKPKPEHLYLMNIDQFNRVPDDELPAELFKLDILDCSPPCSSYSICGAREQKWGKKMAFREGQSKQVLDDLFFSFLATANKLRPKIIIAENVKGLIMGKARGYVKQIFACFQEIGYKVQLFLLNSASMNVPQKRERIFFVARREDLNLPALELNFKQPIITAGKAIENLNQSAKTGKKLTKQTYALWQKVKPGEKLASAHPTGARFNEVKLNLSQPAPTLTTRSLPIHEYEPRRISQKEAARLQTFPDDYDFGSISALFAIGMSVPPRMMECLAAEVKKQLL